MAAAEQAGLDLVEVSPNADPPVARIVDWGKYNYQKTKQAQKSRQKTLDMKQMRIGLKIGDHDLDVKLRKAASANLPAQRQLLASRSKILSVSWEFSYESQARRYQPQAAQQDT
jgi:hypothetical protein